jgi:hypothetical protein
MTMLRVIGVAVVFALAGCSSGKWIDTPLPCLPSDKVDSSALMLVRGFCAQGGWKSKEKLRCEKGQLQVLCE